jgi:hypothetical protein
MKKSDVDRQLAAWIEQGKTNEEVLRLVEGWDDVAARRRAREILTARGAGSA